jgi:transcriptional regulator with XRE-family HTH domain
MNRKHRTASLELRDRLATNLRRLRKAKGYTQVDLSRRSGIPNRYISHIEQGRVNASLSMLEALSVALECWEVDLLWPIKEKR